MRKLPDPRVGAPLRGARLLPEIVSVTGLKFGSLGPNTVHLCVDMQRLFGPESPWCSPWTERIIEVVEAIRGMVRSVPSLRVSSRRSGPKICPACGGLLSKLARGHARRTQSRSDELFPALSRFVPPASVIDKSTYSPFSSGRPTTWLSERAVRRLGHHGSRNRRLYLGDGPWRG